MSKQRTKSVPKADWFSMVSIRLCPRELWQKKLLFSHHPGGPRPLGPASPCDWQLRKHNRPPPPFIFWTGGGVSEWELSMVTPTSLPYATPSFSSLTWFMLNRTYYLHLTPGGHLCWSEVISDLATSWSRIHPPIEKNQQSFVTCYTDSSILFSVRCTLFNSLIQYQQNSGCWGVGRVCPGLRGHECQLV